MGGHPTVATDNEDVENMAKKEKGPIGKGKAAAMGAASGTALAGVVKVLGAIIGSKGK